MRLTQALKREIVSRLARFEGPANIKEHFRSSYGIPLSFQHIAAYDASKPQFRVSEKWRTIFDAAREEYFREISQVPISHLGFRLNLLNEAALACRSRRDYLQMARHLEQ